MAAHRYWRLRSPNTAIAGEYMGAMEIELRESAGGADATGSGTASASNTFGSPWLPAGAFDNNTSVGWTTGGNPPPTGGHWIKYDFGAGNEKDIVEVTYMVRNDGVREDPLDIYIEWSDDNVTWIDKWSVLGMAAWSNGETRTWTMPAVTPAARVSQVALEVLHTGLPAARLSSYSLEVLHTGLPAARVTSYALEVLRSITAISQGRRRQQNTVT